MNTDRHEVSLQRDPGSHTKLIGGVFRVFIDYEHIAKVMRARRELCVGETVTLGKVG